MGNIERYKNREREISGKNEKLFEITLRYGLMFFYCCEFSIFPAIPPRARLHLSSCIYPSYRTIATFFFFFSLLLWHECLPKGFCLSIVNIFDEIHIPKPIRCVSHLKAIFGWGTCARVEANLGSGAMGILKIENYLIFFKTKSIGIVIKIDG